LRKRTCKTFADLIGTHPAFDAKLFRTAKVDVAKLTGLQEGELKLHPLVSMGFMFATPYERIRAYSGDPACGYWDNEEYCSEPGSACDFPCFQEARRMPYLHTLAAVGDNATEPP
jgi:hypothetical protein